MGPRLYYCISIRLFFMQLRGAIEPAPRPPTNEAIRWRRAFFLLLVVLIAVVIIFVLLFIDDEGSKDDANDPPIVFNQTEAPTDAVVFEEESEYQELFQNDVRVHSEVFSLQKKLKIVYEISK